MPEKSQATVSDCQAPNHEAPDYEAAVLELETIIEQMETANLPLADSLQAYKRGTELLKLCQTSLTKAEQQIRILSDSQQLIPFKLEQESI